MLAISVRVSPCSDLCAVSSDGRVTTISPFSIDSAISRCSSRSSSPFGPFTFTRWPSIVTVTFFGTAIGRFPIRDIAWNSLPDEGEQLAAGAGLPRLAVGHQPLRRAQDRHAEPVANARDLGVADVLAEPRRRHALERADHRLATLRITQD